MEDDYGKADERVRIGRKPAEGFVQQNAGERSDLARAVFDETRNAMTSGMYVALSNILNTAAKDDFIRVVLWHGAGDSFCAGNDIEDFLKNPPGPGESPQGATHECADRFRQAPCRGGSWVRHRQRHNHAAAL